MVLLLLLLLLFSHRISGKVGVVCNDANKGVDQVVSYVRSKGVCVSEISNEVKKSMNESNKQTDTSNDGSRKVDTGFSSQLSGSLPQ
eukprot:scaffold2820_cov160-Amphora_coffeaeformis.AAC.8